MRTALVSVLAIALFAWFFRDASLAGVWAELRRADLGFLALGAAAMAAGYALRIVRWRGLLAPVGGVSFRAAAEALIVGYTASFLLPARVGEVVRSYLLGRREGLRATSVFATVVLERVLDLVLVLALLGVFVWTVTARLEQSLALMRSVQVSGVVAAVATVMLLILLCLMAHHPERIGTWTIGAARVLPARFARRLADATEAFSHGLAVAKVPHLLGVALAWSVPVWLLSALQIWAVTRAFGISMSYAGSFLQQALVVAGVAMPTPGGVGSFHEAYRIGATVFFGGEEQAAVGAAIVLHALAFVPVTALGLGLMVRDGLTMGHLQSLARSDEGVGETL